MSPVASGAHDRNGLWIPAFLLFSLLVSIYLLTYSGTFRVDDEHILAARAQSLALWGDLTNPQVYGNDRVRELAALPPVAAAQAEAIEPAQAAFAAGLYRLGLGMGLGGVQTMFTLNIFVTAGTGVIVFLTVTMLGKTTKTATWCALLFGLATMAWPYSKTFYRDPLAMLMVAIVFLGWAMATSPVGGRKAIAAALMLLGILGGILAKNTAMVLIPAFGITLLSAWLQKAESGWLLWGRLGAMAFLGALLVGIAAALPKAGPLARYSLTYLVSLGRYFVESLNRSSLMGMAGPFLSPAKSVFLFSPPLILAIYGGVRWWSRHWLLALPASLTSVLLAAAQGLFYGEAWAGSFGWGLRYMLPALPPLMLAATPAIDWLLAVETAPRRWVLASLLCFGGLVQVSGAVVSWHAAYDAWLASGLNPYLPASAWEQTYLGIPFHIGGLLRPSIWDLAWLRVVPLRPVSTSMIVATTIILALISIRLLRRCVGSSTRFPARAWAAGLAALAFVLPVFPTLHVLLADPTATLDRQEFEGAVAWVEGDVGAEDVVVVDAYGTPLWAYLMQTWSSPARWYSLPFEIPGTLGVGTTHGAPPSQAAIELFQTLSGEYGRLWYLSSSEAPDSGLAREIGWLDLEFTLRESLKWQGLSTVEARLYEVPDPQR